MADSTPAVYSARPRIEIAGSSQPALEQGLQHLEIVETIHGLYRCEAQFVNGGGNNGTLDYLYFDRKLLDFGKTFTVKLDAGVLFTGRIMALEGHFPATPPPMITVLVEDRFQDLRMTRRTRTFEKVTDADIFRRVAGEHGLKNDVDAAGPTYKVLAQVNQSDLAFLRERARAIDAELWMDDTTLRVRTRALRRGNALTLTLGSELKSFTATADLATQRTSVTANGWDVASKSTLRYEADESVIRGELDGDTSGAHILQDKFGARKEAVAHAVPLNSNETQSVAEAYFKTCARRFVIGRGAAVTQPKLRVGALLDLRALGPLFSGKYYVIEARHVFNTTTGLRTEFTADRAGIGPS